MGIKSTISLFGEGNEVRRTGDELLRSLYRDFKLHKRALGHVTESI